MTSIRALALLLALLACAPRKSIPPADSAAQAGIEPGVAISLERTACFGGCPVYRVSVSPAGEVTYLGKTHVRHAGSAKARIPADAVKDLLAELDRAGYFSFADRYVSGETACGPYATDSPAVITTVALAGKTKRIEHDYGCSAAPGTLVVLERRIDEVLGTAQWTGH